MYLSFKTAIICCALALFGSCVTKGQSTADKVAPPSFPTPPVSITDPAMRASYIVRNVWQGYDSLSVTQFPTETVFEQFLSDYFAIGAIAQEGEFGKSIAEAIEKANESFYLNLIGLAELYLDNPRSPVYNEGQYAIILQEALKSSKITFADSVRFVDRLALYEKNKPGTKATDFQFALFPGTEKTRLSLVKAPKLLLMFYDPDCHTCQEVLEHISVSELFSSAAKGGKFTLLCIYSGTRVEEWRQYRDRIPSWATVGIEQEMRIDNEQLYHLRAFPTLYLLDEDKTVILRDVSIEKVEAYLRDLIGA